MKNKQRLLLGLFLLTLVGCEASITSDASPTSDAGSTSDAGHAPDASCSQARDLPGEYSCFGECVSTDLSGKKSVARFEEKDTITVYPGTTSGGLFQIEIEVGDFREVEIGTLAKMVLRAATAEVSGNRFPVLEEYVFDVNSQCQATGFTKLVRNPTLADFKVCRVSCTK